MSNSLWGGLLGDSLILPAGQARDLAVELELQQHGRYHVRRQAASRAHRVYVTDIVTQMRKQARCGGTAVGRRSDQPCYAQFLQQVLRAFHQLCALLDERVAALGMR